MKFSLVFLCIIFLNLLFVHNSISEESKKVKCKEHIDAALKQYWDHEKDAISISNEDTQNLIDITEENDEESEENLNVKVIKEVEKTKDDNDDDQSDENDKKNSSNENDKKLNKKDDSKKDSDKNVKADEDDDDDDEEDDHHENDDDEDDSEEKEDLKKKEKNIKDDDDDNSDEKEDLKKNQKKDTVEKKSTQDAKNESEEADDIEKKENIKNEKKNSKNDDNEVRNDDDDNEDDDDENDDSEEVRSRDYIQEILRLEEIGSVSDKEEQTLIQNIFKDLKKIYESAIKPLEILFKYRSITNRLISDSEIFAKPLVLFIGGKSSGKTTLINYLLGLQKTPWEFPTGQPVSHSHFTVIGYGPEYTKLTPMEFAADMQFSNLQQFGENFLEQRIQAYKMPLDVLERMTIIDTASIVEQVKNVKSQETDIFQWFFDRSDVIYMTLDLKQLTITSQMKTILEQLKGRDIRFVLTKADTMSHSQLILSIGQLFWILSPLIAADRPPKVYALTTQPLSDYDMFLDEQEQLWLTDLSEQVLSVSRIESRIASVRRHAVRVRNHAKLVDCYLNTYYKHKGLFTFGESAKKLATEITQNPQEFNIFSNGIALDSNKYHNQLSTINSNINIENNFNMNNINKKIANEAMQNISRYDLPDADVYKAFFSVHTLLDFKPLSSTCSFFKGCPIDKLDVAIAYQLPDLVSKYKKLTKLTLN